MMIRMQKKWDLVQTRYLKIGEIVGSNGGQLRGHLHFLCNMDVMWRWHSNLTSLELAPFLNFHPKYFEICFQKVLETETCILNPWIIFLYCFKDIFSYSKCKNFLTRKRHCFFSVIWGRAQTTWTSEGVAQMTTIYRAYIGHFWFLITLIDYRVYHHKVANVFR